MYYNNILKEFDERKTSLRTYIGMYREGIERERERERERKKVYL